MKPQPPAEGILLHKDFGDSKFYVVPCDCCSSGCEHQVCIEADEIGVTVTTYTTQKTNWWSKNRWQVIWQLLTTGYVKYEASIIMTEQQAVNYAHVLESACKDVNTFRSARQLQKQQLDKKP
jgi:hypothetical protein